jgi:hypothetical protein
LRGLSPSDEIISETTQTWKEPNKYMKQIISFNMISVIAVLALTVGCATTTSTENTESMLVASGFKVVTPKTAEQSAKLQKLPPGHVAQIHKGGKTFYVFPDAAHNQAYVGGPHQYQAYQQYRLQHQLAQQQLETAEMYQDSMMGWGGWGGWGVGWGPGWY